MVISSNQYSSSIVARPIGVSIAAGLQVNSLRHCYTGKGDYLRDINFSIKKGEITCLLGESGCGKSTLLRLIAGLEKPCGGEIWLDELQLNGKNNFVKPQKRGIGLIFQDYALFPHLTVLENVAYGLHNFKKEEALKLAKEVLHAFGLFKYLHHYSSELSGGEQQRVALARTLITRPALLLMDEPFSGLDKELRHNVRRYTVDILRQTQSSSIIVTHDPLEALEVADSIIFMHNGKILQKGNAQELYKTPVTEEVLRFFSEVNQFKVDDFDETSRSYLLQRKKFLDKKVFYIRYGDLRIVPKHYKAKSCECIIQGYVITSKKFGSNDRIDFRIKNSDHIYSAIFPISNTPYKKDQKCFFTVNQTDIYCYS